MVCPSELEPLVGVLVEKSNPQWVTVAVVVGVGGVDVEVVQPTIKKAIPINKRTGKIYFLSMIGLLYGISLPPNPFVFHPLQCF